VSDRPYTLRRGLFVLGQGIRRAPGMFALAVVGSALYGVMTAGTGWVLGRVTRTVITPAFRRGRVDASELAGGAGLMVAVVLLLVVGVVVRRIAAGRIVYDLGALYRRRVTAQYLRLPLSWHGRHPTGQLLSNANADVEATWLVFAPLPMAIGVVVMLVVAVVAMVLADPVLAVIGLCVFPAVFAVNVVFQRHMSPRVTRAQQLRAEVSDVAHESFDGALVVKAMGREQQETERFAVTARRLRDANVAAGRTRGLFDPMIEAIPALGILTVLAVGASRASSGATSAADVVQVAYTFSLLAFPVRALGWVLGELPRSVVGWDRVDAVLRAQGRLRYGEATLAGHGAAAVRLERVAYAHVDTGGVAVPALSDVTFDVAPGSTLALVGPTGAGKSTLTALLVRLFDPDAGAVRVDGTDLREVRDGGVADVAALVPQQTFLFDDTVRGNITLGDPALEDPTTAACARRCAWPRPRTSSRRCRPGSTPRSASAAPPCPAASASASPSPGRWCAGRGCSCWTTPPARSTRTSRPRYWPACGKLATVRLSCWSPTARPRSRLPTTSCSSSTAGWSSGAATAR